MQKLTICLLLALLLSVSAGAVNITQEEQKILGIDTLKDGLTTEAKEQMETVSPAGATDFGKEALRLFYRAISGSESTVRTAIRSCTLMIGAAILCAAVGQVGTGTAGRAAGLAGTLAITAVCAGDIRSMMGLAGQALDEVGEFMKLLMPVMTSCLAASGGAVTGGALYTGSMLFLNILSAVIRNLIQPLVLAGAALSAAEAAAPEANLDRMRELIFWAAGVLLKGMMYLFTAYLTLTGLLSAPADAMALRTAKAALSGVLPVVGSIMSDATETVLSSAGVIKAGVGVFGLLAVLAICLLPFLKLAVSYLSVRIAAAAGAGACLPEHTKLMGNLSTAMGLMLSMVGCEGLMALLAVSCFLQVTPR